GGIALTAHSAGAKGPHRAIFRVVRADRKGHVLCRPALDRRRDGGDREPEGRHGRAGAVLRDGAGAAGTGASRRRPGQASNASADPGSITAEVVWRRLVPSLLSNNVLWLWVLAFARTAEE